MIKLRLPRKVVFVISGVVVLTGATGAAALFIGRDVILGPSQEELSGVSCKDVVRVAEMRKGRGPWLRKFVKVPPGTDGITRVKTAIRVATKVQKTLPADLIEIAVLDDNGPDKRAFMRGRAIGAEVILVKDPSSIPGVNGKFTVRYFEGGASGTGMFYGQGEDMSSAKAEELLSKMTDLTDCTPPPGSENAKVEKLGHGEGAPAHGEDAGPAGANGQEAGAQDAHGKVIETKAEGGGFISNMLSKVGLGGGGGKSIDHSVSQETGQGEASDTHPQPTAVQGHGDGEVGGGKSFMSKMMGMVGLGGDDKPKTTIEHSGGPAIVSAKVKGESADPPSQHSSPE